MKQIILKAPYTLEERNLPIPEINDNQVLLKVKQIGICGSDIQMYHGNHKYMSYPVVIGHEVAATVVKVGNNVVGIREGDNITVEPQLTCNTCYLCRHGHMNVCEQLKVLGVHVDGFACEYFAADSSMIYLCEGLTDDETALVEPLAVAMGAVRRAGTLDGKNVVVIGAGIIGNLVAQCAKIYGANVVITDVIQKRLDAAMDCGIKYAVNTAKITLKDLILQIFGDDKADIIFDCAATKTSLLSILNAARACSTVVITGNFKIPVEIEIPIIQRQEINILGHMMYLPEDFKKAIRLLQDKKISIKNLAIEHFDINSLDYAFRYINEHNNEIIKCMINIT